MIGFTAIDEQANIVSQEARVVFIYLFIRNMLGVVAAAVEGNVDCEDYISHLIPLNFVAHPPLLASGGWPAFNDLCVGPQRVPHPCVFFARVGGDAACAI